MGRAKKNVEVEAQVIARGNVVPMMTETESEEIVQYVSDEDAAREDRLVSEIRMITEQTKQVVLFNSIEIGRRLTEAKAMVKRGTWGTWLKERVDYSQRTANNFMKIYQEYGRNGLAEKSQALVKRVEKKANYISREYPEFDTLFGKDTQSWSDGSVNSQLLVIVPWDESKETFESVAKWLDSIVYEI